MFDRTWRSGPLSVDHGSPLVEEKAGIALACMQTRDVVRQERSTRQSIHARVEPSITRSRIETCSASARSSIETACPVCSNTAGCPLAPTSNHPPNHRGSRPPPWFRQRAEPRRHYWMQNFRKQPREPAKANMPFYLCAALRPHFLCNLGNESLKSNLPASPQTQSVPGAGIAQCERAWKFVARPVHDVGAR